MYDRRIKGLLLFRIKCDTIKMKCIIVSIMYQLFLKILYSTLVLLFHVSILLNRWVCRMCQMFRPILFCKFFYCSFTIFIFIIISYSFIILLIIIYYLSIT